MKISRALISVSDKAGVVEFAKALLTHGVQILSTGGTAQLLKLNGVVVTEVADYTGFPEMMEGRVKTLHPKIHGGILARRDKAEHVASMRDHGIEGIDMVVVNLYPFAKTVAPSLPAIGSAEATILFAAAELLEPVAMSSAATPATCGTAKEVPSLTW